VFRDAQDLLFTQDGVPAQLVRPGDPRRPRQDDRPGAAVPERRTSISLLRRLLRPALG